MQDLETLVELCKELNKSIKSGSHDQTDKILTLLYKRSIATKEDLKKAGLSKTILVLSKSAQGQTLALVKSLISKWKSEFGQKEEPKKDFAGHSTGVRHRD
jgi:hypothetical protein